MKFRTFRIPSVSGIRTVRIGFKALLKWFWLVFRSAKYFNLLGLMDFKLLDVCAFFRFAVLTFCKDKFTRKIEENSVFNIWRKNSSKYNSSVLFGYWQLWFHEKSFVKIEFFISVALGSKSRHPTLHPLGTLLWRDHHDGLFHFDYRSLLSWATQIPFGLQIRNKNPGRWPKLEQWFGWRWSQNLWGQHCFMAPEV